MGACSYFLVKGKFFPFFLSLIIPIGVFSYLFSVLSVSEVIDHIMNANRDGLIAFIFLSLGTSILRMWRYAIMLTATGYLPPRFPLFLIVLVRNFCSDLLPARLGTWVYVYLVTTRLNIPLGPATATFALAFLFDIFALVPLLLFCIFFFGVNVEFSYFTLVLAGLGLGAFCLFFIVYLGKTFSFVIPFVRNAPVFSSKVKSQILEALHSAVEGIKQMHNIQIYTKVFLLSIMVRLGKYGALYMFLYALLVQEGYALKDLSFPRVTLGLAASELAASLPISGIAGFGAYQGAWILTFKMLGFPLDVAQITSLSHHLFTQVYGYSLGVLALSILMLPWLKQKSRRSTVILVGAVLYILLGFIQTQEAFSEKTGMNQSYKKPPIEELKQKLSPLEYLVTQEEGTETPFKNKYWNNHEEGIYVDVVTGEPLFSSLDKFDSGTGWPSFTKPLGSNHLKLRTDNKLFLQERVEVRSKEGDSHLGHVFDDGPEPGGKRYCINSAALRFVPVSKLITEGYGDYLSLFEKQPETILSTSATSNKETAILAGGCFWGVEELIRKLPGVVSTRVGYTGGSVDNPDYGIVSSGKSEHAEAIEVVFDSTKLNYADLLRYFFRLHDPTTLNRQGNDRGTQYRSVIFYLNEEQRRIAEQIKNEVAHSGKWKDPVQTAITQAKPFYEAEEHHQDYLQKHPNGYTCHFLRN